MRRSGALLVALALLAAAPATGAGATPQTDLAADQQRAAQLEAEIEANGNRVSVLDEQYVAAQLAIKRTNEKLDADAAALATKERETRTVRGQLSARAAELYMGAGNPAPLAALDITNTRELGRRSAYSAAAAAQDTDLLNRAKVAIEQLGIQRASLEKSRLAAVAERNRLDRARAQITQATAEQQALLAQVKGKIAGLVNQIAAARQRRQEAAARAELAARQAREQARAAELARRSTRPSNGSSSGRSRSSGTDTGTPPPILPAPSPQAQVAVDTARAQLGKPYVYAASGPNSFDCSGLTMYAWAAAGVSLSHSAAAQYGSLPHVPIDSLQPGDLVFFGSPIHHVGIFVGGGTMIEAPFTGASVRYHSIYRGDYAGSARP